MTIVLLPCCHPEKAQSLRLGLQMPRFETLQSALGGLFPTAILELVIKSASMPHAHLVWTQQHDQQCHEVM